MKKKKLKPFCEHIDNTNMRDCYEDAEFICLCCGVKVCSEHKTRECPYGGMGYIEL